MNRLLVIAAFSFGILSAVNAEDEIKLPESEKTAVFTMDFSGGMRAPVPGDAVKPSYLQVFADGRVVNSAGFGKKANQFKMTLEQLQTFLKRLVNECEFYELESEKITDEIKATGQHVMIADAATVDLKMELARSTHELSVYAPRTAAKQFPKIEALQHVAKIENLGRQLALVAAAGGYETVERALTMTNNTLKEKGFDPMTIDDLSTCKTNDETVTINFNKKFYLPNGRWKDWINVKYVDNGDEEAAEVKTNIEKKDPEKPKIKSA